MEDMELYMNCLDEIAECNHIVEEEDIIPEETQTVAVVETVP